MSKITPSLISSLLTEAGFENKTEPAIQSCYDPRYEWDEDPIVLGCRKLGISMSPFPDHVVEIAATFLENVVLNKCVPSFVPSSCLSYEDAVVGETSRDGGLVLSTSAGYPFNMSFKSELPNRGSTKAAHVEITRDNHSVVTNVWFSGVLLDELAVKRQLRSSRTVPSTIFWDHLKDERRGKEKLRQAGGTRVFSLSPIDFTIECRALFVHFQAAFMENWFDLYHAISIDPDSMDWSHLKNETDKFVGFYVTLDFKDFGSTLPAQLTFLWYDLACKWYEKYAPDWVRGHDDWRRMIAYEVIYALHLMEKDLYRVFCGIPSGHPNTTLLNTYVHILLILIAFIMLTGLSISDFDQYVILRTFGDDGFLYIHESIIQKFNAITICAFFKRFNLTCTDGNKSNNPEPYLPLSEVTFLKRGFIPHPILFETWLAPLSMNSIVDCAHWIWKSPSDAHATRENAEQSLRLCFGHGPVVFNKWQETLNSCLSKLKFKLLNLVWTDLSFSNYATHPYFADLAELAQPLSLVRPGVLPLFEQVDTRSQRLAQPVGLVRPPGNTF